MEIAVFVDAITWPQRGNFLNGKFFFFFCCCYAMLLWLKLTFVFIDFGDLVLGSVSKFEFAKDVWLEFIFLVEF